MFFAAVRIGGGLPSLRGRIVPAPAGVLDRSKERKSWMPAVFDLTRRTPPGDDIAAKRPVPVWEMGIKRHAVVYSLASTKNAAVQWSVREPARSRARDAGRRAGGVLWRVDPV